jgi:hypothetical protein
VHTHNGTPLLLPIIRGRNPLAPPLLHSTGRTGSHRCREAFELARRLTPFSSRRTKRKITIGPSSACSTMKAREALVLGILLLLAGVFLYAFSGVVVTVYTVTSDSYWTYYEFQHNTHHEYQCLGLGVSPLCTFFHYFAYGGAGVLSFVGAVMIAVSLYRFIEAPRVDSSFSKPSRIS